MEAWLETTTGARIPLRAVCSIGRSSANTLVLDDPAVSRRHALIHAQDGGHHWLVDLGASNGVRINGRRVRHSERIRDSDKIEIASNVFVFHQTALDEQLQSRLQETVTAHPARESGQRWLLVSDIEGSTRLSQSMPTGQLSELIGNWFLSSKDILERRQAVINKFLGDGYLAYWPQAEIPAKVVWQTITDLKTLQASSLPTFRMVIHFGEIAVDAGISEGEENLLGPDVNFVFRMEKLAGVLGQGCLLSRQAAQRLEAFGGLTSVGEHAVPSFEGRCFFYTC